MLFAFRGCYPKGEKTKLAVEVQGYPLAKNLQAQISDVDQGPETSGA